MEDVEEVEVEEVEEEDEFSLSFIVERSTTLVGVRSTTIDAMDTLTSYQYCRSPLKIDLLLI